MEAGAAKGKWKTTTERMIMEREIIEHINEVKEKKRRSKKCKKMCINSLKFFVSTGGLLLINAAYLVLGGYIFQHLEAKNELEGCKNSRNDYNDAENATLILLMDMAQRLDGVGAMSEEDRQAVIDEFTGYLQSFALSVLDTGYDVSVDCDLMGQPDVEGGSEYDWSFTGSFVFAITIVTTIGYGHISPGTMWGRLVCIAYAIIGIPLFLMAMGKIGEVLANLFILTYSTVCCCGCCRKKEPKEKTEEEIEKEEETVRKHMAVWKTDASGKPIPPDEDQLEIDDEEEEEEIVEEEEEEEVTVPLTITLLVWAVAIIAGAVMFEAWEDWDFNVSAYYCFTTLTTIGFGDYTPTVSLGDLTSILKGLATIFYIVFGMAAVSMCIQLVADEVVAKFKWIGEKFGIKKKEEEEEGKTDEDDDKDDSKDEDVEQGKDGKV